MIEKILETMQRIDETSGEVRPISMKFFSDESGCFIRGSAVLGSFGTFSEALEFLESFLAA